MTKNKNEYVSSKKFNQFIADKFAKTFSCCDMDMMFRKEYTNKKNQHSRRMLIVESKYDNEHLSISQFNTIIHMAESIKWEMFDSESGAYVIRHDSDFTKFRVYSISDIENVKYTFNQIDLYHWINATADTAEDNTISLTDREIYKHYNKVFNQKSKLVVA